MRISDWSSDVCLPIFGSGLLRVVSPGLLLATAACGALALIGVSVSTTGTLSGYSLLAVGLMNSIMFPTIFSLACEKLRSEEHTSELQSLMRISYAVFCLKKKKKQKNAKNIDIS